MAKTKEEIFEGLDQDTLNCLAQQYIYSDLKNTWRVVESEITGYDEGNVTETVILEYLPEGRFFEVDHTSNSWDDYGSEEITVDDFTEVVPTEKTITVYVPK